MVGYYKRNKFNTTQHQRPIVALTLIPTFTLCVIMSMFVLFFHNELIHIIHYTKKPPTVAMIQQWSIYMVGVLWLFFFVFLNWAHVVTSNILGAFDRITQEMDNIIMKGKKRPIKAREQDELANELLARINVFIEEYPDRAVSEE